MPVSKEKAKKNRQARNKIKKDTIDYFKPLNITDFGTEKDPCFGKLYDVKADECGRCGDSEICLIVMGQNMNKKRLILEKEKPYLDIEPILEEEKDGQIMVPRLIRNYLKKGYSKKKIKKLILKKFPKTNIDKIERLTVKYGK